MIKDKQLKKLIKPVKGLTFKEVAEIYGCGVRWAERNNNFYNVNGRFVVLCQHATSKHFCHELAHHLQRQNGPAPDIDNFSEMIAFERQAERIAYYLHKAHFYYLHHAHFNAYICQWHKDFLWEWWYGDPSPYLED